MQGCYLCMVSVVMHECSYTKTALCLYKLSHTYTHTVCYYDLMALVILLVEDFGRVLIMYTKPASAYIAFLCLLLVLKTGGIGGKN